MNVAYEGMGSDSWRSVVKEFLEVGFVVGTGDGVGWAELSGAQRARWFGLV